MLDDFTKRRIEALVNEIGIYSLLETVAEVCEDKAKQANHEGVIMAWNRDAQAIKAAMVTKTDGDKQAGEVYFKVVPSYEFLKWLVRNDSKITKENGDKISIYKWRSNNELAAYFEQVQLTNGHKATRYYLPR